jgi:hypothetical protein
VIAAAGAAAGLAGRRDSPTSSPELR